MAGKKARKNSGEIKSSRDIMQRWIDYYIYYDFGIGVQCVKCGQWRQVCQYKDESEVPEDFICSMWRIDENHRGSCRQISHLTDEDFPEELYTPGSLVWAKMAGWPWWPGMIEDCPDEHDYHIKYEDSEDEYHVVFLGSSPKRHWAPVSKLKDFSEPNPNPKKGRVQIRLQRAVAQANEGVHMTLRDRFRNFSFAVRYKGPFAKVKNLDGIALPPICIKKEIVDNSTDFESPEISEEAHGDQDSHRTPVVQKASSLKSESEAVTRRESADNKELQTSVGKVMNDMPKTVTKKKKTNEELQTSISQVGKDVPKTVKKKKASANKELQTPVGQVGNATPKTVGKNRKAATNEELQTSVGRVGNALAKTVGKKRKAATNEELQTSVGQVENATPKTVKKKKAATNEELQTSVGQVENAISKSVRKKKKPNEELQTSVNLEEKVTNTVSKVARKRRREDIEEFQTSEENVMNDKSKAVREISDKEESEPRLTPKEVKFMQKFYDLIMGRAKGNQQSSGKRGENSVVSTDTELLTSDSEDEDMFSPELIAYSNYLNAKYPIPDFYADSLSGSDSGNNFSHTSSDLSINSEQTSTFSENVPIINENTGEISESDPIVPIITENTVEILESDPIVPKINENTGEISESDPIVPIIDENTGEISECDPISNENTGEISENDPIVSISNENTVETSENDPVENVTEFSERHSFINNQENADEFSENNSVINQENAGEYSRNDSEDYPLSEDTDPSLQLTPYPSCSTHKSNPFSYRRRKYMKFRKLTDDLTEVITNSKDSEYMPYLFYGNE